MRGALVSKLLGLVREILIARAIGASLVADSFRGGLTAVLLPIRATLVNVAVIGGVLLLLVTGQAITLAWSFTLAFNAVAMWAVGTAVGGMMFGRPA